MADALQLMLDLTDQAARGVARNLSLLDKPILDLRARDTSLAQVDHIDDE